MTQSAPSDDGRTKSRKKRDFFVSFNKADMGAAKRIRGWLEEMGQSTFMQHPDFHAGSNFVLKMDEGVKMCRRVIAVLSPNYLASEYTQPEWAAFFAKDPTGKLGLVVSIRVSPCNVEGLLRTIRYVDLVGIGEDEQREKFMAEIRQLPAMKGGSAPRKVNTPKSGEPIPMDASKPAVITVNGNVGNLAGRDLTVNNYSKPPKPKVVLERRDSWVSDAQAAELKERITDYAQLRFDTSAGKLTIGQAFSFSYSDFNKAHDIPRYDALPAERFEEALAWIRQAKAILTRKLRKQDRPAWRNARIGSIKKSMKKLGRDNADYYPEIATRLKIKPFTSLTKVTDRDLQRIYTLSCRDAGENED